MYDLCLVSTVTKHIYFTSRRGTEYSDDVFVCLSVCLSNHIYAKPHGWTSPEFLCMLSMATALSSGSILIRYQLLLLWLMSSFHIMVPMAHHVYSWVTRG